MKTLKRRRLTVVTTAIITFGAAVGLILFALGGDSLSLFRAPSDLTATPVEPGQRVRLGGLVAEDSHEQLADGVTHRFTVTDCASDIRVEFRGLLPDLFREGQGIVSEGVFDDVGTFQADTVLAKHDENYTPEGTMPKNVDACTHDDRTLYKAEYN